MKKRFMAVACMLEVLGAAGLLMACGEKVREGAAPAVSTTGAGNALGAIGRASGAPIAVSTVLAVQRNMETTLDAVGTVTPVSSVDVKPQINSVVTRVHVKEGQYVRMGEVLFTLDPRPDQVNVAKVRAQMRKDEAMLADAQRQLARSRDLVAQSFVSQGALDANQAQVDAQLANVAADRAALEAAQLALAYTTVRATGAGRLGAVNVFAGSAVQANQTNMVTLTQLDPINVSFNLPQRHLNAALGGLKAGGVVVGVQLPESKGVLQGHLQFVDNAVDAATGTVKVRARFSNRDATLWPGAFVKVNLIADTLLNVVVVPTAAIVQNTRGTLVYVAEKDKAVVRPVAVLATQGEESAVTGVAAGERVVLDGRQNLRPDAAIVERSPATAAPAAAPRKASSAAAP